MRSSDRPPTGSGNARLALATLALSPVLGATYAGAVVARKRFATADAARRALDTLGLSELARGRVEAETLGSGKSNAVIRVQAGDTRLVLKKALPFGSLMAWGARHFGANFVYSARTGGGARVAREAAALRFLADHGVAVPRCLAASPDHELLAIEWIDGAPAATALHEPARAAALAREIGQLFARVHALGVTLADGHPGNMLVEHATGKLVLFDLEFAEVDGATSARRGFDLAYASVLMPTPELRSVMLEAYGPRDPADRGAFATAEQHLLRFRQLIDMERARWAPTSAR